MTHFMARIAVTFATTLLVATSASALEVTEEREFPPFAAISARGTISLDVSVGESQRIIITRDEEIPVSVEVEGGVLIVRSQASTRAADKARITIAIPHLEHVSLSGVWAHLVVRNIHADRFRVALSGSTESTLSGTCGAGEFSIAGAAQITATELACRDANIDIAGSGHANVRASDRAVVRILGSGDVDLYGGATITADRRAWRKITVH